jgi:hypothetical protein
MAFSWLELVADFGVASKHDVWERGHASRRRKEPQAQSELVPAQAWLNLLYAKPGKVGDSQALVVARASRP